MSVPAAPLPPGLRRRRDRSHPLPPATRSASLFLRLPARHIALFRFLLEAWENVAYFTVLDRREALIKVIFSPHMREEVERALTHIARAVPFRRLPNLPEQDGGGRARDRASCP